MTSDPDSSEARALKDVSRGADSAGRPVLIFDGDCGFCRFWIERWREITGDAVEYLAQQDPARQIRFPNLDPQALAESVHCVEAEGRVTRGAEAVARTLAVNPRWKWWSEQYHRSPKAAKLAERGYEFVARHRVAFSRITRFLWGGSPLIPTFQISREIFLAGLALIHLVAFASLGVQLSGLIGEHGILPATSFLQEVGHYFDRVGVDWDRFRQVPTLFWINSSDLALHVACGAGLVLAGLALAGVARAAAFFGLWFLYLSFVTVGQDFLAFQWDALLLEVTVLAVFLSPWIGRPREARAAPTQPLARWLCVGLLFQLMLESGLVKLHSGDPTWLNLTALEYHYWTQPLPGPSAWWVHQWPPWFHRASCGVMFCVELLLPWLLWAPRRPRLLAGLGLIVLQGAILLTGNYAFFNGLTILLCVLVIDDASWRHWPRRPICAGNLRATKTATAHPLERWRRQILVPVAIVGIVVRAPQLVGRVFPLAALPVLGVQQWLDPWRTLNGYGLFAVMTTRRPEIIVEGSADGETWRAYEFRFKPGDVLTRPTQVAPHQPRLDWQMWFAALGNVRSNPWFIHFCVRLLEGSPDVLALLKTNPFADSPPRFVRARLFDYRFSTLEERRKAGAWWVREERGEYCPPLSLRELK